MEFLERSREHYPEARRVLLTAYADTEAAIQAINTARIHYYLNKPWDPPEEKLYPVLNDLLDDWKAGYRPAFEGLRVIGHRWSLRDHNVRTFLSCNHVPYRWFDISGGDDALKLLEERHLDPDKLPVVLFPDGSALVDPEPEALATKVGLSVQATQVLRPDHRGCGSGGTGGCRVWGQRRPAHAGSGTRGAGRTGGHDFADRELPRLSRRHHRGRHGQAGSYSGHAVRGRIPHPAGHRLAGRRPIPLSSTGRWARSIQPCGAARSRRAVPQAGDSWW